jgi:hypothetical protein
MSIGPGSSVAGFNGSEDTGDDPDNGDLRGGSAMFLHDPAPQSSMVRVNGVGEEPYTC